MNEEDRSYLATDADKARGRSTGLLGHVPSVGLRLLVGNDRVWCDGI